MTTDIRDALHHIGDSVDTPPLDLVAFDGHLRGARRRRNLARGAVATAGLAAVGLAAWLVPMVGSDEQPDLVADPPPTAPATSPEVLAFAQSGRLFLSRPDTPMQAVDTGLRVEEVVARVPGAVLYLDRDSHLERVDVREDGTVGKPSDVVGPEPVQWAGLDATGTMLWYVDRDDALHRRELGSDVELSSTPLPRGTTVWDVGTDRWVGVRDDVITLHVGATSYDVEPYFAANDVELGGSTMAVMTLDGTELWSSATGRRVLGSIGGRTAALSPDGRYVASGANQLDLDDSMTHGLWLEDSRDERVADMQFDDQTGPVTDIWWADDERFFVVVEADAEGRPLHRLYECTVDSGCHTRIEDESGTLQLPRD